MKKIIIGLAFSLMLFSLVAYSSFSKGIVKGYNDGIKYVGINMKEIKEEKIMNGSGEEIGKRGIVTYNPDKTTDKSLSSFYKDKIRNSGYRYYTLINEKDKTQGIVSVGCINVLTYCEIDDFGSIVKANKNFEVNMDDLNS